MAKGRRLMPPWTSPAIVDLLAFPLPGFRFPYVHELKDGRHKEHPLKNLLLWCTLEENGEAFVHPFQGSSMVMRRLEKLLRTNL
jgi:hypothetical protein